MKKPIHIVQLGRVKVAIWENAFGYSVQPQTCYTKDGTTQWTSNFRADVVPTLTICLEKAVEWMMENPFKPTKTKKALRKKAVAEPVDHDLEDIPF